MRRPVKKIENVDTEDSNPVVDKPNANVTIKKPEVVNTVIIKPIEELLK